MHALHCTILYHLTIAIFLPEMNFMIQPRENAASFFIIRKVSVKVNVAQLPRLDLFLDHTFEVKPDSSRMIIT